MHASSPVIAHLVRHGEVWNPEHLVYAGLDGFGLSERGAAQAEAAAEFLADRPITSVVSSPLQRAVETATPIAAKHGVRVTTDERLTESALNSRWAGHTWESLPERFPGEVEAYLSDPENLPFSPEPLAVLADRIASFVVDFVNAHDGGHVVIVSHQDPIEAGRRRLTGRTMESFHSGKPSHASVVTIDPATTPWTEIGTWAPDGV